MKAPNGDLVKVLGPLQGKIRVPGKPDSLYPIVDKEGTWVRVEVVGGPNKGNRKPIALETLK